jgi:hypothetical protein
MILNALFVMIILRLKIKLNLEINQLALARLNLEINQLAFV